MQIPYETPVITHVGKTIDYSLAYGFHSFRLLTDFVCLYTYEF